jgi:hypothetical protein
MHKERTWICSQEFSWDKSKTLVVSFQDLEMDFAEWLDSQCNGRADREFCGIKPDWIPPDGGWEVFNISIINIESNFDNSGLGKLCIFRKKN